MNAKEKLAAMTFPTLEAMMSSYADEAVRVAWTDHRRRLDFSEASVDELEEILDDQSAEDVEFQTRLWGGYFGEVIRRRYEGEWHLSPYPGDGEPLVPALMIRGSRLYPLVKIYRRLTMGAEENVSGFYKMVAGRMDKTPPVQ